MRESLKRLLPNRCLKMVGKGSREYIAPPNCAKISIYGWMSVAAVIALFITAVTFLFITNDLDEKVMQLPAPLQELKTKTIRQRVKVWQIHPAKL